MQNQQKYENVVFNCANSFMTLQQLKLQKLSKCEYAVLALPVDGTVVDMPGLHGRVSKKRYRSVPGTSGWC